MNYKETFQVPNTLADRYLPSLSEAELKLLIVIIRQTLGWIDPKTGKRKTRDRISQSQFVKRTGLCRKIVSKSLGSLVKKGLVNITGSQGQSLNDPQDRKGIAWLFYSFQPEHFVPLPCVDCSTIPVYNCLHNKTNYSKINKTKLNDRRERRSFRVMSIGEVMKSSGYEGI